MNVARVRPIGPFIASLPGVRPLVVALPLILLFISGCAAIAPAEAAGGGTIRVLVLKDEGELRIRGASGVPTGGEILLRRSFPGTAALAGEVVDLPVRFTPSDTFIHVNGRPYRGSIEVYDEGGGLMAVNELPLETYIVGIINHEISSRWHMEAVKAQAVIARTYALYKKGGSAGLPYDLEGTVLGQVYRGVNAEDDAAERAVRSTRGEILTYGGEPALTVYHSNAGGRTDASRDVWSGDYPYLTSVASRYDSISPNYSWEFSVRAGRLGGMLEASGRGVGRVVSIRRAEVLRSGRVRSIEIRGTSGRRTLSGEELRKLLGYSNLKSTIFRVSASGETFIFTGRGSGHGVGLSQWGAKGMAEAGYSYRRILGHYYPGTTLKRIY